MPPMTRPPVRAPGRPTLDAVAARAGVGRGTASRVLNGSPQVSAQAKAAVEAAIEELGYVPNRAARSLVTQRTDSVALVVSESQERVFGEPFFAGVLRGINSALLETPLQLWLAMAATARAARARRAPPDRPARRRRPAALAARRRPAARAAARARHAVRLRRPVRPRAADELTSVDVDNAAGARKAVEYLLGNGAGGSPRSPGRRTWRSAGPGWPATATAVQRSRAGRVRRLQRGRRRTRRCGRCWTASPTWTPSSSPPT